MKLFPQPKGARKTCRRRNLRRGMAIGYVVALMVVVTAFSALLLAISSLSTRFADTYDAYLEQKLTVDEIGGLILDKYAGDGTVSFEKFEAQGFKVEDSNGRVVVSRGDQVDLTVVFTSSEQSGWELSAYVYGEYGE